MRTVKIWPGFGAPPDQRVPGPWMYLRRKLVAAEPQFSFLILLRFYLRTLDVYAWKVGGGGIAVLASYFTPVLLPDLG